MGKIVECAKANPSSGCKHVARGDTVEEVMQKAAVGSRPKENSHAGHRHQRDIYPTFGGKNLDNPLKTELVELGKSDAALRQGHSRRCGKALATLRRLE